jgi:Family of unknown function (DUF6221)
LSETGIQDLAERLNEYLAMDRRIALDVERTGGAAVYIAYNDPARMLREVAFKRALIADLLAEEPQDGSVARRLRLLAAIYEEETP